MSEVRNEAITDTTQISLVQTPQEPYPYTDEQVEMLKKHPGMVVGLSARPTVLIGGSLDLQNLLAELQTVRPTLSGVRSGRDDARRPKRSR